MGNLYPIHSVLLYTSKCAEKINYLQNGPRDDVNLGEGHSSCLHRYWRQEPDFTPLLTTPQPLTLLDDAV